MSKSFIDKIRERKILRSGINFSAASTLNTACQLLVGFMNMRWLGPELLGLWQSVTIIDSYLPFLQLGIQSGLNIDLPVLLGANDKEKVKSYLETALAYAIGLSMFLFVLAIIVVSILIINDTDKQITYGVIAIFLLAITKCFQLHYIATFRSAHAFDKLSKIYVIDSIVTVLLLYFIYEYQYYGLLIYQTLSAVIHASLLFFYAPYRHTLPRFHKPSFLALLKPGTFMVFHNQILGIIRSIPRLLLLNFGGVVCVGLFSPALTVGTCMNLIPDQLGTFLHPQLGYKYGQTKCAKDMWGYLKALIIYAPLVMLPFSLAGWFVMPFILENFFPKYIDSLWAIRIMLIGFLFSTAYLSRGFLTSIKAYKPLIFLELLNLLLFVLLPVSIIYITNLDVLCSVALGLSISYFITYIVNAITVRYVVFLDKYNIPIDNK